MNKEGALRLFFGLHFRRTCVAADSVERIFLRRTMSRFHAALINLGTSIFFTALAMAVAYFVWYPPPLIQALGATKILVIFFSANVLLGPVLTFVAFDSKKKTLRLDMIAVAGLQLAVFLAGLYAIAITRPAWIVFNVDRFDVVRAHELDQRYSNEGHPEFRTAPWLGPRFVAARSPTDLTKRSNLVMESALGGSDLPQRLDLYIPLDAEVSSIRDRARKLNELTLYNENITVDGVLKKWPDVDSWLPLMAKNQPMVILLRKRDAQIFAVVNLRPWN